jgi:predicted Zn-dependent protease
MSDTVEELIEKAYALDRVGDERGAIKHYDAAYKLGVPEDKRKRFLVGYASTLRNVGRAEEAVAILAQAIVDYPDYPAFSAFLALALADAGHPKAALATMLGCALDASRPDAFDGYERALAEYHHELLQKSQQH